MKRRPTERKFTTALFVLRCIEIGLSIESLEEFSTGAVFDIFTEKINDGAKYAELATQEDFDRF